ncbi:MAG TPA: B12-binding domain-containing radical SAM protein [Chloroflexi bacterium]|nr:B12-binding domain-containing radical SAM protein [Chloroflexota bacterium]
MSLDWQTIAEARSKVAKEIGTVVKDWGGQIPVALAYPNSYYLGMSSLAVQVIYRLFNEQPGIVCERTFFTKGQPISLESQRPLMDFVALAFTLSFEMDYFNLVEMLRRAGIPPLAEERDERHPLLLAGGPCVTANPEPLAPIFDALVIGEGEEVIPTLAETLRREVRAPRLELLRQWAIIPGLYVPRFYQVEYDGLGLKIEHEPFAPHPVKRQWVRDLDAHPTTSVILTDETKFGDMYLIEVSRGCGRGCRFCLAGFSYRPLRERSVDVLLDQAKEGLGHREKIGLVGAALSDYSQIDALTQGLRQLGAQISVSSLRADSLSETLLEALVEGGTKTLTIAPEAGSARLRSCINKDISEEEILEVAQRASRHFPQLKLYFMLGLPGEREEDIVALAHLTQKIKERFSGHLIVSLSPFVPKAQTPYQWAPMAPLPLLEARLRYVKQNLSSIEVRSESAAEATIQATLARGDRRVGSALARTKGKSLPAWKRALARQGLAYEALLEERPHGTLPWKVVDNRVNEEYLWQEWKKGLKAQNTPPCPLTECLKCGACDEAFYEAKRKTVTPAR